jgi:uncharacterized cupredoxin-like copper-binding protein
MATVKEPPLGKAQAESGQPPAPHPVSPEPMRGPPKRRRPLLWLVAIAVIVLGGALFLILAGDDDSATPRSQSAKAPSGMPMTGGSGGSQGANSTVQVELGEMYVKPSVTTVRAGKVKFAARNVGSVEHELMVERMPIRMDAPGMPTEDAALGMIEDMGPMHRGQMTLRLKPGKYELFCNVPGHYAAGQRTTLTVSGT